MAAAQCISECSRSSGDIRVSDRVDSRQVGMQVQQASRARSMHAGRGVLGWARSPSRQSRAAHCRNRLVPVLPTSCADPVLLPPPSRRPLAPTRANRMAHPSPSRPLAAAASADRKDSLRLPPSQPRPSQVLPPFRVRPKGSRLSRALSLPSKEVMPCGNHPPSQRLVPVGVLAISGGPARLVRVPRPPGPPHQKLFDLRRQATPHRPSGILSALLQIPAPRSPLRRPPSADFMELFERPGRLGTPGHPEIAPSDVADLTTCGAGTGGRAAAWGPGRPGRLGRAGRPEQRPRRPRRPRRVRTNASPRASQRSEGL